MVAEALAALALLPAAAHSHTYVGESDQGFPVRAVLRGEKIDRIRVKWAAPCPGTGYLWGPETTMWLNRKPAPFKVSRGRYADGGTDSFPFQGGHGVIEQHLSGRVSARALSGTQKSTVSVYGPDGTKLDSCSSKVRFRVLPAVRHR